MQARRTEMGSGFGPTSASMDTPPGPVPSRPFRLTYPCALAATALIVGGAPPSAGLTGCAAPVARAPNAPNAPNALASAPEPTVLLAASNAPRSGANAPSVPNSPPAITGTAPPGSAAAVEEPPSAPTPVTPSTPPH